MQIREVLASELEQILDLLDLFDRPRSPRPSSHELEQIMHNIQASKGTILGAFLDAQAIGTCTVNVCPNLSWAGRPYAIIENVMVAPANRGSGVGTALLKFAQQYAQDLGCYKIALMTGSKRASTLEFYEKAGFTGDKIGFQRRFGA
tara:strand:+ start:23004 stop:23444 length:441 start_codon:yes stop_codon:yes gene_type:complete